jgi:hypothetical protein
MVSTAGRRCWWVWSCAFCRVCNIHCWKEVLVGVSCVFRRVCNIHCGKQVLVGVKPQVLASPAVIDSTHVTSSTCTSKRYRHHHHSWNLGGARSSPGVVYQYFMQHTGYCPRLPFTVGIDAPQLAFPHLSVRPYSMPNTGPCVTYQYRSTHCSTLGLVPCTSTAVLNAARWASCHPPAHH